MNFVDDTVLTVINNEYDYSNIVPSAENIAYVIQYCENVLNQFLVLFEEDEKKNEKLRQEYQNYQYKKSYKFGLEIKIRHKNYDYIFCKSLETFIEAVKIGKVNNLISLEIQFDLSYRRGEYSKLQDYENEFKILFKPYEIKFFRKSNHNENHINLVENSINQMLTNFPVANSIFCTK